MGFISGLVFLLKGDMMDEIVSETEMFQKDFNELLDEKQKKLKDLKDAVNSETTLKLELLHKSNEIKLHPEDVKEKLGLSKLPTEKQIQAHIDEEYKELTDDLELAKQNTSLVRKDLEFIDDCISVKKYLSKLVLRVYDNL